MSETPPEPPPAHPWLPVDATRTWLQLDENSPLSTVAEWCRKASARYCERQRPGLFVITQVTDPATGVTTWTRTETFAADDDVVLAGLIGAARLFARRSSPAGLASFGEFGATEVLRLDPDVSRLLGTGRHASPEVG